MIKKPILTLSCGCLLLTAAFAGRQEIKLPELVEISPGAHQYRVSGEFLKDGYPVNAPKTTVHHQRALHIMKYQVSSADYAVCVADGACGQPFKNDHNDDDRPATGVSFIDAVNYANWLTGITGITWRLPSDAEWAYAAGSRFFDDGLEAKENPVDPTQRWVLKYQQATTLAKRRDPGIKAKGVYGANENGVYDLSGNVWEWTNTCYQRSNISGDAVGANTANCGVRVVEGRHRAYMTFFVQDAKSGGCSVGAPPDYLGFRLVRDNPAFFTLRRMRNWWTSVTNG